MFIVLHYLEILFTFVGKKGMLGFKGRYGKWKDLTSLGDSYCSVAQSCPTLTPWTAAHQACLSFTISQSLLKLVSFESVILSNHLILCHPLLIPASVFSSIGVFSSEMALRIRWPKYWSFSISPSNKCSGYFFYSYIYLGHAS